MPRVIGIDPGTVSIDLCGLDDGRVFLDRSVPSAEALRDPAAFVRLLREAGPVDLVAGPSGYGLPLVAARDATDDDLRLAVLAVRGEEGGIGGLRALMQALVGASIPMVFVPGVLHLPTVPPHRKVNRVDMGTADKVCAVVLALHEQVVRHGGTPLDESFLLLELGGAFTAAIAVERGSIVDGLGGTSGPIGVRAAGALDGEVAYLAGSVDKRMLFGGGAAAIAGAPDMAAEALVAPATAEAATAREAFLESAAKALAALAVSAPGAQRVLLSGRLARLGIIREELARRIDPVLPNASVDVVTGLAHDAKHAAQGAALLADGLAGGSASALVDALRIREAAGTVLDHLYVIAPEAARRRLGLARRAPDSDLPDP